MDSFTWEQIKVSMRSSPHRATVHRTVAFNCSNPPSIQKVQHLLVLDFLWWGRTDSNHRSDTQQIYSLSPLATRELPQIFILSAPFGAGRRTRSINVRLGPALAGNARPRCI